jgi:serine/threonine-protein kinase
VSIEPGQQLLHYRILDKLGEGGMGVVWKAVDTTLDREVAIKVLPDSFAGEAERLARFEREARVLASLNHPHIAGIHGIHQTDGVRFLSMELVTGEELADALARGKMPVERTYKIMRDVAEALEAAHESGIIHRDLKPANVRLTPEDKAKVLDFGLAKAYDPATASDPMSSQTMTSAGTVAGLILGTAAYMSPEQASGQPTDRRADIWSFGVMLHEMLSGKRLFAGETISHTLADVLRAPIELDDLPETVDPRIRKLIKRCLDRDRLQRLRDIGEARIVLEDLLANPTPIASPTTDTGSVESEPQKKGAGRWPWLIAALAAIVAVIGFTRDATVEPQEAGSVRRFMLDVEHSINTRQGDGLAIAISGDGLQVVARGGSGTDDRLYRRRLDAFETTPIEGTVGGNNPLFSPDDRWISFIVGGTIKKVRSNGGPSSEVGRVSGTVDGMSWAEDGYIYYGRSGRIWRLSVTSGETEAITEVPEDASRRLGYPSMLPGGRTLLVSVLPSIGGSGQLFALDLETKELIDLEMAGSDPRYLPSGHVMFAQGDYAFSAPFDLRLLKFVGDTVPVHPRAWVDQGRMQIAVSQNGTVVYLPGARGQTQTLVTVDLQGEVTPLLPEGLPFMSLNDLRISRDGHRLLVSVENAAIWMIDLDTRTPTLMSEDVFYPHWSPDGRTILYGSTRGESFDIYTRDVDLSEPEQLFLDVENNLRAADWTTDGRLVIREEIPGKGMDLTYVNDLENPELIPLLTGDDDELAPVVSTDNKWIVFVSNYSGQDEIYVTGFPEGGARSKISIKGGTSPTWAPDGSAIYYFEGSSLIEVTIETEPRFRVTGRRQLFSGTYVQYRWSRQYDIHPDGNYFILVESPERGQVEVVENWFAELLGND